MALVTECLQHYVPGRSPSWADLLADLAGLALGMLMVRACVRFG
jgi:VanZ family protein